MSDFSARDIPYFDNWASYHPILNDIDLHNNYSLKKCRIEGEEAEFEFRACPGDHTVLLRFKDIRLESFHFNNDDLSGDEWDVDLIYRAQTPQDAKLEEGLFYVTLTNGVEWSFWAKEINVEFVPS